MKAWKLGLKYAYITIKKNSFVVPNELKPTFQRELAE